MDIPTPNNLAFNNITLSDSGPRDLEKYKSSEWLLKWVAFCLSFGFSKICLKCWYLQIETKQN